MPYDKDFAKICAWLQERGYAAYTFNSYIGAKGPGWTEIRDKSADRFVRRM